MKNNLATWIFMIVFMLLFSWGFFAWGSRLGFASITFLLAFVLALNSAIQFFDWISGKPDDSWIFKIETLKIFKEGAQVSFWARQIIFYGGFGIGLLIMKFS